MLFSLVIPMYKVEQYLRRCVDSCLAQDLPEGGYEIVMVDDGSPDRSGEIAREYASEHPFIRVISQSNQGLAVARNAGLAASRGDYVWFIDSDDWIECDCLGHLASLCSGRPDIISLCAANMIGEKAVRRFHRQEACVRRGRDLIIDGSLQVCAPFSVFRREFLLSEGLSFVPGIYHEDSEFTPRAYYKASRVVSTDRVLYFVYQNPVSITRSPNPKKAFDSIEVVQRNISSFASEADPECRLGFNDLISSDFNHALKNSYTMGRDDIRRLNAAAYDNRYLLEHLKHAGQLKYRIAGTVYGLFPRHMVQCYKFMHLLKKA